MASASGLRSAVQLMRTWVSGAEPALAMGSGLPREEWVSGELEVLVMR